MTQPPNTPVATLQYFSEAELQFSMATPCSEVGSAPEPGEAINSVPAEGAARGALTTKPFCLSLPSQDRAWAEPTMERLTRHFQEVSPSLEMN